LFRRLPTVCKQRAVHRAGMQKSSTCLLREVEHGVERAQLVLLAQRGRDRVQCVVRRDEILLWSFGGTLPSASCEETRSFSDPSVANESHAASQVASGGRAVRSRALCI
jgi:hypothetical protein